jgi:hypothetical protein
MSESKSRLRRLALQRPDAKTVLAEILDWLAQHGLAGPTDTGDLMHRAHDALAAAQARVEALEQSNDALRRIAMLHGDGAKLAALAGEPQQGPDEA